MSRATLLVGRRALVAGQAAMLIAALVALFSRGATWVGSWKAALDMATGSLALVGPVAAGWAALTYAGLTSRRMPDFAASLARGRCGWLSPALVIWLAGCSVTVAVAGIATGLAAWAGGEAMPSALWILGEAFAVLAAQVFIGAVVGCVVVGPLAAPIAASAVFALGPLSVLGYFPGIFDTGAVAGSLVGLTWSGHVLGLQSAVAIGLAVAIGCVLAGQVSPTPAWGLRAAAVVTTGLALGAWSALESGGHERYAYESSHPEWVCRGEGPRVCLVAETIRPLAAVSAEMHRQAEALIDAGAEVPEVFDQEVPGATPRPGHGVIRFLDRGDLRASADPPSIAISLATPTDCAQFSSASAPMRALRVQVVLADWIGAQARAGRGLFFGPDEDAWLRTDRHMQDQWIAQAYDALTACRLGDLRLPF